MFPLGPILPIDSRIALFKIYIKLGISPYLIWSLKVKAFPTSHN